MFAHSPHSGVGEAAITEYHQLSAIPCLPGHGANARCALGQKRASLLTPLNGASIEVPESPLKDPLNLFDVQRGDPFTEFGRERLPTANRS
jgi:hypothetical protein